MEPTEIWTRTFDKVRRSVSQPAVWLAMQAARPLTIDGSFFVAALPPQEQYLAVHLEDNQATLAIEEALRDITGRILAFRLIIGTTLADWEREKAKEAAAPPAPEAAAQPPPAFFRSEYSAAPTAPAEPVLKTVRPAHTTMKAAAPPAAPERAVSPTWEKLNERLSLGYKSAPYIKYPHGQAQYILTAMKIISDTMDALLPPPGEPRDDQGERQLTRTIERLGGIVNLDPLFLALELLRYRETQGKAVDIAF